MGNIVPRDWFSRLFQDTRPPRVFTASHPCCFDQRTMVRWLSLSRDTACMKEGERTPQDWTVVRITEYIQLVARALCRRADLSAVTGVAIAHGQGCGDVMFVVGPTAAADGKKTPRPQDSRLNPVSPTTLRVCLAYSVLAGQALGVGLNTKMSQRSTSGCLLAGQTRRDYICSWSMVNVNHLLPI